MPSLAAGTLEQFEGIHRIQEFYPDRTALALTGAGWSHGDLRKLARDNALRVLRDTHDAARS